MSSNNNLSNSNANNENEDLGIETIRLSSYPKGDHPTSVSSSRTGLTSSQLLLKAVDESYSYLNASQRLQEREELMKLQMEHRRGMISAVDYKKSIEAIHSRSSLVATNNAILKNAASVKSLEKSNASIHVPPTTDGNSIEFKKQLKLVETELQMQQRRGLISSQEMSYKLKQITSNPSLIHSSEILLPSGNALDSKKTKKSTKHQWICCCCCSCY